MPKNIKFVANICEDGKKHESFSGQPKWRKGAANEKKIEMPQIDGCFRAILIVLLHINGISLFCSATELRDYANKIKKANQNR